MANDDNMQNEYENQTNNDSNDEEGLETPKLCCECCCNYVKWSFKAVCECMECIMNCG